MIVQFIVLNEKKNSYRFLPSSAEPNPGAEAEAALLKGGGSAPVLEVLGPGAYFGQIGSAPS